MLKHIAMIAAVVAATVVPGAVEAAAEFCHEGGPFGHVGCGRWRMECVGHAGHAFSGGLAGRPWSGRLDEGATHDGAGDDAGHDDGHDVDACRPAGDQSAEGEARDHQLVERSLVHEVLIVPVDSPDAPLPYDYSAGQVVEDQVHVLADSSELKPNKSKTVEVDLSPGSFSSSATCRASCASSPMVVPLTVTP